MVDGAGSCHIPDISTTIPSISHPIPSHPIPSHLRVGQLEATSSGKRHPTKLHDKIAQKVDAKMLLYLLLTLLYTTNTTEARVAQY
jgi:hypothetical protein